MNTPKSTVKRCKKTTFIMTMRTLHNIKKQIRLEKMKMKILRISSMIIVLTLFIGLSSFSNNKSDSKPVKYDSRDYWVSVMVKIVDPVLTNLSKEQLRANMPVISKGASRKDVSHLEALGRTLAGIAPWLELGPDQTPEGKLRAKYIELTRKAIAVAV